MLRLSNGLANTSRYTSTRALHSKTLPPSYPVIQKCPSPTCECAEMPPDLDIDQTKPLNGTMAVHSEQLLIASGQSDWASKIENEKDTAPWGQLASQVKKALGKGGMYHDPYNSVSVGTCSFKEPPNSRENQFAQTFLFPSFRVVDQVDVEQKNVLDFVKTFLLPQQLHSQNASLSDEEKTRLTRDPEGAKASQWVGKVRPISAPTIMICSHNTRDSRCGILGPLLHTEFMQYVNKRQTLRNQPVSSDISPNASAELDNQTQTFASHPEFRTELIDDERSGMQPINVGMVSHVGGHAWAGNVIVYIPPDYCCNPIKRVRRGPRPKDSMPVEVGHPVSEDQRGDEILEPERSPLAGKSIWYGRVQPKHVEGIVEQTIGHGKIIGELFRGGVNADGSIIRI